MTKNTLPKTERLRSKKIITDLFSHGQSVFSYPIKAVFLHTPECASSPVSIAVTVSKRQFKKAVDRNLVKRHLREAYRTQKSHLHKLANENKINIQIMYIYVGKSTKDTSLLADAMKRVNKKVKTTVNKSK